MWSDRGLAHRIARRLATATGLRRTTKGPRDAVTGLTPEHVEWGYRLLLDREPENRRVLEEKLAWCRTTRDLRADFLSSAEYRAQNRDLALQNEPCVVIKELAGGLRLFVDLSDYVIGIAIIRGEYERPELEFVRRTLASGATAVDLGANVGRFTVEMAQIVGSAGRVFAFEPVPRSADLLARSIDENGFADRVVLERAAAGDTDGSVAVALLRDGLTSGGAYVTTADRPPPPEHELFRVKMLRLDDYPLRRPVAFIKADVEGAEPRCMRGAADVLTRDRPVILSEIHAAQMRAVSSCTPLEFIAEMRERGYECRTLEDGRPARVSDGRGLAPVQSVVFLPV
jgi:FkbM family methyltransferase